MLGRGNITAAMPCVVVNLTKKSHRHQKICSNLVVATVDQSWEGHGFHIGHSCQGKID